jgi:hypothetical protein
MMRLASMACIDPVELAFEADAAAGQPGLVRHRIPAALPLQAFETRARDIVHRQVRVQRPGELKRLHIGVVDLQSNLKAAGLQADRQDRFECVRPEGAGAVRRAQLQTDLRAVVGPRWRCTGHQPRHQCPRQGTCKTVLRQRAARIELRETHGDTAANGRTAVKQRPGAQVETLTPARLPGEHLRAMQGDYDRVAPGKCQANARLGPEMNGVRWLMPQTSGPSSRRALAEGVKTLAPRAQPFSSSARFCAAAKSSVAGVDAAPADDAAPCRRPRQRRAFRCRAWPARPPEAMTGIAQRLRELDGGVDVDAGQHAVAADVGVDDRLDAVVLELASPDRRPRGGVSLLQPSVATLPSFGRRGRR